MPGRLPRNISPTPARGAIAERTRQMREVSEVVTNLPRWLRARVASATAALLPIWALRKMMVQTFINFSVETMNICDASCVVWGYCRFLRNTGDLRSPVSPLSRQWLSGPGLSHA